MQIGQVVGHSAEIRTFKDSERVILQNALVGLELELENISPNSELRYWNWVRDDSLRGPFRSEFVMKFPLCGQDLINALEEINTYIIDSGQAEKEISSRNSVHVHMDVRDLTSTQLMNLVEMYTSVEKVLYKYLDSSRENNEYCIPIYKSLSQKEQYTSLVEHIKVYQDEHSLGITSDLFCKYSGLNLAPISRQGSIEFRMHHGEWRTEKILNWVNILLSLKKKAIEDPLSADEIPDHFSVVGPDEYIESIFGDYTRLLSYPSMDIDMYQCIRNLQTISNFMGQREAQNAILNEVRCVTNPRLHNHPEYAFKFKRDGTLKNMGKASIEEREYQQRNIRNMRRNANYWVDVPTPVLPDEEVEKEIEQAVQEETEQFVEEMQAILDDPIAQPVTNQAVIDGQRWAHIHPAGAGPYRHTISAETINRITENTLEAIYQRQQEEE